MLRALTDFIAEIAGGHRESFAENDYRLAAAALLVHVVTIDGMVGKAESDKLRSLLAERFALTPAQAEELVEAAIARDAEAVDLYSFTSILNRALDEDGRKRVIEMMFEVAYADGGLTEFEDNLVWRAAELLNVASRDRVEIRKQVRDAVEDGTAGD
ncbi:TerB family tellurite resistance protein [Ancylobacter sp. 6x-1]|uniref:TerB family tellurite resistance protein n=1 Tax=Ancylobacter crimeensis TaxID=2579147 RepID=A0ABT0DC46_9HYPH|nr:TerB family tellurite resistance protein [Ancylobacter crimeensis]MCK0197541.1 TerB family tellurite resistance protein [Ancylobacter crimeensis]